MRERVKLALSLDTGTAPFTRVVSGVMRTSAPGSSTSAPPTVACLNRMPVLLKPVLVPLRASSSTEPFSLTLVVAEMRPLTLTARPTSVALPRGMSSTPSWRTLPAPSTSTSRPRSAGMAGLTSEAYSVSRVGSCR